MKVLIVRSFPDILNLDTYNVQEIGLAKALTVRGVTCGVVLYNGENQSRADEYCFEKEGKQYFFPIYWLKGFSLYKNGFMPSIYKIIREYDVIQVHEYDQIFSWMFYTRPKKPTLIYHGPYFHEYAKGYNLKCRVFDALFLRWRKHDQVVALTKSELASDFLRTKGFEHVHTVGVGVDRDKFKASTDEEVNCLLTRDESKFRLLYVGKIEERRNVYFLVELFEKLQKKHANLELVIVGNGEAEYLSVFRERIKKWTDHGKIRYFQKATQKELALIYQNTDLFVFTSNYEIFGMVLLEAMYFRLPVISSTNGGASVLIEDGKNGYMMEQFNVSDWQEKVETLIQDKNLYEVMKQNAYERIAEHFLWDTLADSFYAGYEEAVKLYQEKHKKC